MNKTSLDDYSKIKQYFDGNFSLSSMKECSYSDPKNKRNPLVLSNYQIFNFDQIKRKYFNDDCLPCSVDGICFFNKKMFLFEFKAGVEAEKCEGDIVNFKYKEQVYFKIMESLRILEKEIAFVNKIDLSKIESYFVFVTNARSNPNDVISEAIKKRAGASQEMPDLFSKFRIHDKSDRKFYFNDTYNWANDRFDYLAEQFFSE